MPIIGILALQGDYEAHARCLRRLGLAPLRPSDAVAAGPGPPAAARAEPWSEDRYMFVRTRAELRQADALILPGGESTTMLKFLEDQEFWQELLAFSRRQPCFGTCAGAILLAREAGSPAQRSLGALDIAVERNAYGRQVDSSIRRGRLSAPAGDLEMVFIRAPKIRATGPGVEVLARESGLPVLVRQGKVLGATFHPELTDDLRLHELFLRMVHGEQAVA